MTGDPNATIPVTVLVGLSRTSRDELAMGAVHRDTRRVLISYSVDGTAGGVTLTRSVRDASGLCHREVAHIVDCCLSCSVGADVPAAIELVVAAERWSQIVLSVPGAVEYQALAPTLAACPSVHVNTVTAVVDAPTFVDELTSDQLLLERNLQVSPADRRSTAALLSAHIESCDVVAIEGTQRLSTERSRAVDELLSHLAPLALCVRMVDGGNVDTVITTGRHAGRPHGEEREHFAALAAALCVPECGVSTVAWSADAALHPVRLHAALAQLLHGVVRSRGWVTLKGREGTRIRWSSAGGGMWLGDAIEAPFPPTCQLVFTGLDLDAVSIKAMLDECLATMDDPQVLEDDDPFLAALGPVRAHG